MSAFAVFGVRVEPGIYFSNSDSGEYNAGLYVKAGYTISSDAGASLHGNVTVTPEAEYGMDLGGKSTQIAGLGISLEPIGIPAGSAVEVSSTEGQLSGKRMESYSLGGGPEASLSPLAISGNGLGEDYTVAIGTEAVRAIGNLFDSVADFLSSDSQAISPTPEMPQQNPEAP